MGKFEEFKQSIINLIQCREEIPNEVIAEITKMFGRIQEIYERKGCANASLLEGIDIELDGLKRMINDIVADNRRNEHMEAVMSVAVRMEKHLEELQQARGIVDDDELQDMQNSNNHQDKCGLEQIGSNNERIAKKIMDRVDMALRDIQSRQRRFLSNTGQVSDATIEDIQYEVLSTIRGMQKSEQDIFELFEKDDKVLKDEIMEKYEEYMQNRSQFESKESEATKFRDSLNAGISLEEQSKSARKFLEEQEEQATDRPKLLADELPELLL